MLPNVTKQLIGSKTVASGAKRHANSDLRENIWPPFKREIRYPRCQAKLSRLKSFFKIEQIYFGHFQLGHVDTSSTTLHRKGIFWRKTRHTKIVKMLCRAIFYNGLLPVNGPDNMTGINVTWFLRTFVAKVYSNIIIIKFVKHTVSGSNKCLQWHHKLST